MDILILASKLATINVTDTLIKILNKPKTQEFIINLNTRVQLYKEGEDSTGVKLSEIGGGYAPSTKKIKSRKGQPTNRVTLYDTGDFYDSFSVKPTNDADYIIDSDPIKNGRSLFVRWGKDIEGLNEENQKKVLEYLEREFYKEIYR